jgi:hypothetical protein
VIQRLPGVEPSAPELIVTGLEPPDMSTQGLVGNLLAREEAGEWTRGEGLISTLQLVAGDADAASVLRHPDQQPEFREATGIVQMAEEYNRVGMDESAKGEIGELLGRLVFSNEQLEAMAGIGSVTSEEASTATGTSGGVRAAVRLTAQPAQLLAQGAVDCIDFYYDFAIDPGVGDCLEWEPVNIGPDVTDKYRIFIPAPNMPQGGWSRTDFQNARLAIERTAAVYEGLGAMPNVNVVFTAVGGGSTLMSATNQTGGKPCGVFIYTSSQGLTTPKFQQSIAHELAHCFTGRNLTPQTRIKHNVKKWWEDGVAEYLSNVAYESVNDEWEWRHSLSPTELSTSVVARDYENFVFFQHIANESSTQGVLSLLGFLPGCGTATVDLPAEEWATCDSRGVNEQAAVLAHAPDIRELYHSFAERLGDASVADTGGPKIPYEPKAFPVTATGQYDFPLNAFGVIRLHLQVPDGLTACLEHDPKCGIVVSWRSGKPDGLGFEQQWQRTLPRTLKGEAVFVATTIDDGAAESLKVKDFVEKPSDCDKDNSEDDSCELDLCGPSDFYKNPDQLDDWLSSVLPPLSL